MEELHVVIDQGVQTALDISAKAFSSHAWASLFGGVLMLVIAVLRSTGALGFVPKNLVPAVAVVFAAGMSIATGLATGHDWFAIVSTAFATGLAAIASWEAAGQHVVPPAVDFVKYAWKRLMIKLGFKKADAPPTPPVT